MKNDIVITGYGAVSPFGLTARRLWSGLAAGQSAIREISGFDATPYRSKLGAEVPAYVANNKALAKAHGDPGERATLFAAIAAQEALSHAGLSDRTDMRIGCVLGTLCSSAGEFSSLARDFTLTGQCGDAAPTAQRAQVGYQLDFLLDHFGLEGPAQMVSTACSSTTDAIGLGADLLTEGACDIALAGGGDMLVEAVHAGFSGLQSLAAEAVRPFDRRRDGFVIGEGAGFLVLETRLHAEKRGAPVHGAVLGYGLSNTATSLTAPSRDGSAEALAIRRALSQAKLPPEQIDYINTHGTATPLNDLAEAKAIAAVFGHHAPAMIASAIKPLIGHCMGAAGVLQAISTVLSLRTGIIPPAPGSHGDMEELTVPLATIGAERPLRHAISQSFGFGGACSCLVLA